MCRDEQMTPAQRREQLIRESGVRPFTDESFDQMVRDFSADPLFSSYCAWRRKFERRPHGEQ